MWVLFLGACVGSNTSPDEAPTLDTGWFTDTAAETGMCQNWITSVDPEPGTTDWYRRRVLEVTTASEVQEAYSARLLDAQGEVVASTLVWDGAAFTLEPAELLQSSTSYVFETTDCTGTSDWVFQTSNLGDPIEGGVGTLQGRTYVFNFADATWIEPAAIETLMALYFNTPILLEVEFAGANSIDLMGGIGYVTEASEVKQATWEPSFGFPISDFSQAPYLIAETEQLGVYYEGYPIPIHNFHIETTFSPDGETMSEIRTSGLGDTRYMGPLLNSGNDPDAVCTLAVSFGAKCVACPDGNPYCLDLVAVDLEAEYVQGLDLQETDGT